MKMLEVYRKLNARAKAAMWFTTCSFFQKGISFITVPIFTRLLSTEEYGVYTLYNSWLSILTIFTSLYIYNGVYDNALSKFEDDRDRMTSSLYGLSFLIGAMWLFVYLPFRNEISALLRLDTRLMIIMFIEMLFTPALYYWSGRQRFEYRYQALVAVTLGKSILNPVLGLILVLTMKDRVFARIIAAVIVEVAFDSTVLLSIMLRGRTLYVRKYWNYAIRLAVPILPHYLSGIVLSQGDRVMIDRIIGKTAVALYGVAYSIGMIVQIFVAAVNSAITPWMYSQMKKNGVAEMQKTFRYIAVFIGAMCIGLMIVSPEVVLIFGSRKYIEAATVIPPVAGSVFFIFLYSVLSFPQFFYEKTKFLAISSIVSALLNILLNGLFIPVFGFVAAGYTTLFCYIVYSLGHYYVSRRILLKEGIDNTLFSLKDIIIWIIVLTLMCLISSLLFDKPIIRYGIVAAIMIMTLIYRQRIVELFKVVRQK